MSGPLLHHIAYPRLLEELRDERRLNLWLNAFAQMGYHVALDENNEFGLHQYGEALREPEMWACVAADIVPSLQQFITSANDNFSYTAYWLQERFSVDIGISYSGGMVVLTWDADVHGEVYRRLREQWIKLVEMTYQVWNPLFGYDDTDADTSREQALALKPSYLYTLNCYGPEMVAKLGRERLLNAHAQILKPQENGGILLGTGGWFEDDLAEYLGLPSLNVRWRRWLAKRG